MEDYQCGRDVGCCWLASDGIASMAFYQFPSDISLAWYDLALVPIRFHPVRLNRLALIVVFYTVKFNMVGFHKC